LRRRFLWFRVRVDADGGAIGTSVIAETDVELRRLCKYSIFSDFPGVKGISMSSSVV